jgi:uncharacterized protein (TIGR00725 family)
MSAIASRFHDGGINHSAMNLKTEHGSITLRIMKLNIGVLGPNTATADQLALGVDVGRCIAAAGAVLLCGGLGGMMQAAAEGAKAAGGETVGILPGNARSEANPFIDTAIPTGLGVYRNAVLVSACDAVIAIHGAYGTLSEIAFALRLGTPVVGLNTWEVHRNGQPDPAIHVAHTAQEAVDLAIKLAGTSYQL